MICMLMRIIHAPLVEGWIEAGLMALYIFSSDIFIPDVFSFYWIDTIQGKDASENALKSWHN